MFVIFSVFYILIAAAMIVLILMQRGAGADAGSGFGGGASATVFGARGSSNFMTRATGVLAALFFVISLGMGIYISRGGDAGGSSSSQSGLGVMAGVANTASAKQNAQPAASASSDVPRAARASGVTSDVPAAGLAPATATSSKAPASTASSSKK